MLVRLIIIGTLFILTWILVTLPSFPDMDFPDQKVLRVYTANIHDGNQQPGKIASIICESRAQIVLLVEYTGRNIDLEILVRKGYRIVINDPKSGADGVCLLVRDLDDVRAEITELPTMNTCRRSVPTMSFSIRDHDFSFIGVHAPPSSTDCSEGVEKVISNVSTWISNGRIRDPMGVTRKRDRVILAGDFDATSLSGPIRRLKTLGLKDSYAEFNWRPGPTWSPAVIFPAMLRVDYIFSSMRPLTAKTIYLPGSDHRGLVADFRFQR